jgi:DNA-binding transcriptional LysR family regulator
LAPSVSVLLNRLLARGKFRHVQVLLNLAELGSLQRTADAIGMTQSAVTQSLASLEELLETQLFLRHARGVRPTPACTALLPSARQVMVGLAESAEIIFAHSSRSRTIVRLLASSAAINGLLAKALPAFVAAAPEVQVHLADAEGEDQLLAIARGEVDLVACRCPPVVPEGWRFTELLADRFVVVCSPRHPMAGQLNPQWEQLAQHAWLMPPIGTAARERFEELAVRLGREPPSYGVVTRVTAMSWWLLREHILLAFAPLSAVRNLLDAGELVQVQVEDSMDVAPLGLLQPALPAIASQRLVEFFERWFEAEGGALLGEQPD